MDHHHPHAGGVHLLDSILSVAAVAKEEISLVLVLVAMVPHVDHSGLAPPVAGATISAAASAGNAVLQR